MISLLLRGTFYPVFIPSKALKKFTVFSWKVSILNVGREIAFRRIKDEKPATISTDQIGKKYLLEPDYIELMRKQGYILYQKTADGLEFILETSGS